MTTRRINVVPATGATVATVSASPPATLRIRVHVNNNHCHLYAICEQEAPEVFRLRHDGRLDYRSTPDPAHHEAVLQAARICPMQAIDIEERHGAA